MTLLSLVTVAQDDAARLAATLESVAAQRGADVQYVVQDGDSTDATRSLVTACADVVDVYCVEADRGASDARNRALAHVSGRYVLFLDCGTVLASPRTLADIAAALAPTDDVAHGQLLDRRTGAPPTGPTAEPSQEAAIPLEAAVVRADLLREMRFDETLSCCAALDLFARCRRAGRVMRAIDVVVAARSFDPQGAAAWLETFHERRHVLMRHAGDGASATAVATALRRELIGFLAGRMHLDAAGLAAAFPGIEDLLAFAKAAARVGEDAA